LILFVTYRESFTGEGMFNPLRPCLRYFFIFVSLISFHFSAFAAREDLGPKRDLFKVEDIQVQGTRRVERESILDRVGIQPGMMLDNYLLREDIEKIYSLKFFETVQARREGSTLIFVVEEKPVIGRLTFEGNLEVKRDDLLSEIRSREFNIIDINTVQSDVKALQKHYEDKGFYLASVGYEVRPFRDDTVELVFTIQEFEKVRVKKITFLGNQAFSDTQLKAIMETREEGLFSFMSGAGNFREFNFMTDIERLKYFYRTKGYFQVNVGTPEITVSEDKKWVFITVKVVEGPMFSINRISFQGELLFTTDELLDKMRIKPGSIYSEEELRLDIQALTELYQDQGYAFANVLRTLSVVPGENMVDIEFSFEKGKIASFGRINISGNSKTRDKVIRRELRIREGERFSGSALRRSRENVERLGFFEPGSVVFNTVSPRGRDDVLDVDISVRERNTGQISLGAGYSTATGGFIQASIAQNNFRGLGQNLAFSLSMASNDQRFNLGFTEPYLLDTKWSAGGDIFRTKNEQSLSFSYLKQGFDLRVGYPIFDYTRLFLTYKLENTKLDNVRDPTIDEDVENGLASSLRLTLVNDKRNNIFEPSGGHYVSVSAEYAGIGGDKFWWRHEADGRYYYNIIGDLVFRSRLYVGNLDTVRGRPIPRSEKYQLGGSRNLRGYDFEDIGPKTSVVDPITGRVITFNSRSMFSAFSTLELEHPLAREAGLKWVLFFDAGDANTIDNFKPYMNYGFGFRWFSPIGVLRFEFGYPLNPDDGRTGSQFHFDIGQLF
jgi:outer membrane protein insertion porin family